MNSYIIKIHFNSGGHSYGVFGGESEGDALGYAIKSIAFDHKDITERKIIKMITSVEIE